MKVTFTALSGARTGVDGGPCCYLLELEDVATLLLDCGWDASFDAGALEKLAAVAPNIDAVLLSHSSLAHVGALPRARSRFGLRCPVYATTPIYRMGQLGLYDAYKIGSKHTNEGAAATFDEAAFSLDEVDEAFDAIKELQFAQAVKLAGKRAASGAGASNTPATLTIAPHPAGHTVGGCFWRLSVGAEEILYCPEYNHMKERHLPAGVLPELVAQTGAKPTLLIAPCKSALAAFEKTAPRQLAEFAHAALVRGGDVLIPTDAAGRCLEIIQVLEGHWRAHRDLGMKMASGLPRYPIVLLHSAARRTLDFARSQIEYMGEDAVRAFDSRQKAENLFELRHVQACHSIAELASLPSPKVVLATSGDLSDGPAAELLPSVLAQPNGLLLLTGGPATAEEGSPAKVLSATPTPKKVTLAAHERVPLKGEELKAHELRAYEQRMKAEAEAAAEAAKKAAAAEEEDVMVLEAAVAEGVPMEVEQSGASSSAAAPGAAVVGVPLLAVSRSDSIAASPARPGVLATPRGGVPPGGALTTAASTALTQAGEGGANKRAKTTFLLPYSESFPTRDEFGSHLSEVELKRIADGAAALTALEVVTMGGGDDEKTNPLTGGVPKGVDKRVVTGSAALAQVGVVKEEIKEESDEEDEVDVMDGASANGDDNAEDDGEANGEDGGVPSKWVSRDMITNVRCAVRSVNLSGLSDGRSIKAIISQLQPHKIILVRGSESTTDHLNEFCRTAVQASGAISASVDDRVFAPSVGVSVDGSSGNSAYTIKLSDAVIKNLVSSTIGPYEIARVNGVLEVPKASQAASSSSSSGFTAGQSEVVAPLRAGLSGVLQPDPAKDAVPPNVNFVSRGEVRLAELKQLLAQAGHHAVFIEGGMLQVNNTVRLRKDAGRLLLEGSFGESYLAVRELLYDRMNSI